MQTSAAITPRSFRGLPLLLGLAALGLAMPAAKVQATIIYQDDFIGGTIGTDLKGSVPDVRLGSYGGSASATWSATTGDWLFNGAGVSSTKADKSFASLPFTPQASTVYTLDWTWTQTSGGSGGPWWIIGLRTGWDHNTVTGNVRNGIVGTNHAVVTLTMDDTTGYTAHVVFNGATPWADTTGLRSAITAVGFITQAGGSAGTAMKSMSLTVAVAGTTPSTTTLDRSSGTPTTSTYGDSLSFDVKVSGGTPSPVGTVILKAGTTTLGSKTLTASGTDGICTITTAKLAVTHDPIVASYDGDAVYVGSDSAALNPDQTVSQATPVVTVTVLTSFHYNGSEQGPNTANTGGSTGTLSFSYAGTGGTTYGPSGTRPTDIGTYTATASVAAETVPPINYLGASSSPAAFTIGAALALPVITDMKLWLDASQLILSDGDPVTTWTDMSGMGNDAAKTSGSPKYISSGLNGKPVIRFVKANGDAFTTANLSSQFPSAATVFIVTTINPNTAAYTLVYTNSNDAEWWRYSGDGLSYPAVFRSPRVGGYCAMPNSGSHIFAISSSSSAWQMWIDGIGQGAAGGSYSAGGTHVIGSGSNGRTLDGDIAEVIEFSRALNPAEMADMNAYLTTKYFGVGGSNYGTWAAAQTPPLTGGPSAVGPDGLPNLLVYALALKTDGTNGSPGTLTGNQLSFTKRPEAVTNNDVTYAIEVSADLGVNDVWHTTTTGVTNAVGPPATISIDLSTLGGSTHFARLVVTQK